MAITRRKFILKAAMATAASALAGYSIWEAHDLILKEQTLAISRLPAGFDGLRVAFVADIHHGPYTSLEYVAKMVERIHATSPDLILLGGDYPYYQTRYVTPVMAVLGRLQAPMGVYAILGNHDNAAGRQLTSHELKKNGLHELTNTGIWLERQGSRLFLCGVDDLITGHPNLPAALAGLSPDDPALLMSHNPDFLESVTDSRILFAFCGHTHGGQVHLPLIGSPIVPSSYGQKYVYGLVHAPVVKGYVTRGVGTIFPPVRLNCLPEIALFTLQRAA